MKWNYYLKNNIIDYILVINSKIDNIKVFKQHLLTYLIQIMKSNKT